MSKQAQNEEAGRDQQEQSSSLFENKTLGDGKSPLQDAFDDLGRLLPSGDSVRAFASDLARKPMFWKVSGVVVALLIVWSYGPSWAAWGAERARGGAETASTAAVQAWKTAGPVVAKLPGAAMFSSERAAFYITEDVGSLLERTPDAEATRETRLALHPDTLALEDYRVDFFARLSGKPVRWVVRATDPDNHYAFALTRKGRAYQLERRTVVAGEVVAEADPVEVDAEIVREGFNKITVVSYSNSVTTLLNGQGVDHASRLERVAGGFGFYVDDEESAERFGEISVRGNEDAWGRFLSQARQLASL